MTKRSPEEVLADLEKSNLAPLREEAAAALEATLRQVHELKRKLAKEEIRAGALEEQLLSAQALETELRSQLDELRPPNDDPSQGALV